MTDTETILQAVAALQGAAQSGIVVVREISNDPKVFAWAETKYETEQLMASARSILPAEK